MKQNEDIFTMKPHFTYFAISYTKLLFPTTKIASNTFCPNTQFILANYWSTIYTFSGSSSGCVVHNEKNFFKFDSTITFFLVGSEQIWTMTLNLNHDFSLIYPLVIFSITAHKHPFAYKVLSHVSMIWMLFKHKNYKWFLNLIACNSWTR